MVRVHIHRQHTHVPLPRSFLPLTSTRPTQDGAINSIVKKDLDRVVGGAKRLGIGKEHWAKLFIDAKTILKNDHKIEIVERVLDGVPPNMRHKCLFNQGFRPLIMQGREEDAKAYTTKIV